MASMPTRPAWMPWAISVVGLLIVAAAGTAAAHAWRRAATIRQLTDPDPEQRRQACWALVEVRDPRVVTALRERVHTDPDPDVREAAGYALYRLRAAAALPDLLAAVAQVPEGYPRARLAQYAGGLARSPDDLPLRQWESSGQPWLMMGAAMARLELGDPTGARQLLALTTHRNADIRHVAAAHLIRLSAPMMDMVGRPADLHVNPGQELDPEQLAALRQWWSQPWAGEVLRDYLDWQRTPHPKWRLIQRLMGARRRIYEWLGIRDETSPHTDPRAATPPGSPPA